MNLTLARSIVRRVVPNGAEAAAVFTNVAVDQAILETLVRFVDRTRFLNRTDNVVLTASAAAMGTLPTGFRPEMLVRAWIATEGDLFVVDHETLIRDQLCDTGTGTPAELAFTAAYPTPAGEVWPTPDANYTLKVQWRPAFTLWTPGADGDTTTPALPDDVLWRVLPTGAAANLIKAERADVAFYSARWAEYLDIERELAGTGGMGVVSVTREKDE